MTRIYHLRFTSKIWLSKISRTVSRDVDHSRERWDTGIPLTDNKYVRQVSFRAWNVIQRRARHTRHNRNRYLEGNAGSLVDRTTACTGRLNEHLGFYCPRNLHRLLEDHRRRSSPRTAAVLYSDNIIELEEKIGQRGGEEKVAEQQERWNNSDRDRVTRSKSEVPPLLTRPILISLSLSLSLSLATIKGNSTWNRRWNCSPMFLRLSAD